MSSVDAGIKYKGMALEAEYYWRWLSDFTGANTGGIADINDHGYQVQVSAMAFPRRCRCMPAPRRSSAATAIRRRSAPERTATR